VTPRPDYDTTLARIAGNIAGRMWRVPKPAGQIGASLKRTPSEIARESVAIARAIVAEVKRTEPREEPK
jgi:hypothetical protein